jgi:transcriptional regulator with XRE-family HTH domain
MNGGPESSAKRLEIVRKALRLGKRYELAAKLGIKKAGYSNWVSRDSTIPIERAIELKRLTGVTLDYLYVGDMACLPRQVAEAIEAYLASPSVEDEEDDDQPSDPR